MTGALPAMIYKYYRVSAAVYFAFRPKEELVYNLKIVTEVI